MRVTLAALGIQTRLLLCLLILLKPQAHTIDAMPLIRRRRIPLPLEHMSVPN